MRIGINAQPLTCPLTGIGQYTFALLKTLVQEHPEVEWVLYAQAPLITNYFDQFSNVKIVIQPQKSKFKNLLFVIFQLKNVIENDGIDVFWSPTHTLPFQKSKKVKYVMSIHDLVYQKMPHTMNTLNAMKERLCFPNSVRVADTIFALSKTTQHDLVKAFSLKKTPILVYPAFEKPTFQTTENEPLVLGKYILSVCTKEPRKNLSALLKAYLLLPQNIKDEFKLVFAGGKGWKSESFTQELNTASSNHNVINFDYLTEKERNNLYANATLFAFPTLYEGFGLPVIEAMSYGVPVLLSDIPIMREIGENAALYADPNNPEEIAEKLTEALTDMTRLNELSTKSLTQHKNYCSWKPSADIIWKSLSSTHPKQVIS